MSNRERYAIDLFAGCGGLSLGLSNAGWRGLFAIEKDPMAFETLRHNLIDSGHKKYSWPTWLPKKAHSILTVLSKHHLELQKLKGKVDLIVGGPPCQGFSMAGRRNPADPRNSLVTSYLKMVNLVRPRFLLMENVKGFTMGFAPNSDGQGKKKCYAELVKNRLNKLGYKVFTRVVNCADFGVPQRRERFILIAVRDDTDEARFLQDIDPFDLLYQRRQEFMRSRGLSTTKPVSVRAAISDLSTQGKRLVACTESKGTSFYRINYLPPAKPSAYVKLMRKGSSKKVPNSLRLARHKEATVQTFKAILETCSKGKSISDHDRSRLGINKRTITPLHPDLPSVTVTTLPDDILHYSEPRILTVRESARLQSFPDWFEFKGKFTTGGKNRRKECPRYSQVGNAVPPLLGEALGELLLAIRCSLLERAA